MHYTQQYKNNVNELKTIIAHKDSIIKAIFRLCNSPKHQDGYIKTINPDDITRLMEQLNNPFFMEDSVNQAYYNQNL